jgi:predicted kinase
MEMILFIGIQATGKSSFYRERFFRMHVRVNFDMLRTRHRERLLIAACLEGKTPFVVDNTKLTREDRARHIGPAKTAGFRVHGYFLQSVKADAQARNAGRNADEKVPELTIAGASRRLELPTLGEGFDRLFFVRIDASNDFVVEDWKDEVR